MFGPKVDSDVDVDHRPVINVNVTIEGDLVLGIGIPPEISKYVDGKTTLTTERKGEEKNA